VIEVVELTGKLLESLAQWQGMVLNIELRDGSTMSGVLGAVSANALILERWEDTGQGPTGDPFITPVNSVRRIVIP
jgi:hypothetical protein